MTIFIDVEVQQCAQNGAYTNSSEIAGATDENGNPQDDADSTMDDDSSNDGPADDNTTDGSNGDEDDSDPAIIEIFDLALRKVLATPGPYNIGAVSYTHLTLPTICSV